MITSPVNDIYYSFCQFLDHQVLQKGQAFTNKTGLFYKVVDSEFSSNSVYASPFKQFVSDYSISGATIPSGVYSNNTFCPRGQSGLKIDYNNGRVLFSGGSSYQNLTVSGGYSVKDFNVYATTKSKEELVFETKYQLNPSYNKTLSGVDKNALVVPGIFITNTNFSNQPLEFGGLLYTCLSIHCVIISDSKDQLDAVGNIIIDQKYGSFPVFGSNKLPFNVYGDFKTGSMNFNYLTLAAEFPNNLGYIEEAIFYKLNNKDFSERYPDLKCGLADFKIKLARQANRGI